MMKFRDEKTIAVDLNGLVMATSMVTPERAQIAEVEERKKGRVEQDNEPRLSFLLFIATREIIKLMFCHFDRARAELS
jgi:hypothetical protein